MDCEHYNYDPAEHDYCPDCGLQDSELLHVEKEVVELREENERLQMAAGIDARAFEAMRKDAERYRWLKFDATLQQLMDIQEWFFETAEELDNAIDAAMRGE